LGSSAAGVGVEGWVEFGLRVGAVSGLGFRLGFA
jgi:hypothetical protein